MDQATPATRHHPKPHPAPLVEPVPALDYGQPNQPLLPAPESLGNRVLRGAGWVMAQSLLIQALNLAARVVVLRQLSKEDFALGTWALSACVIFNFFMPPIADVLVQRQRRFKLWANRAFWVTALCALLILATGFLLGPLFFIQKDDWRLIPFMLIAATGCMFNILTSVWSAQETIEFRFRYLTVVNAAGAVCTTVATIVMAFLHFGPWALVVPGTLGPLLMLILFFRTATFRPRRRPPLRRSIPLIKGTIIYALGSSFSLFVLQADNFFLGRYHIESLTAYFTAYTLSFSFIQLISRSMRAVLLPALSSVDTDRPRQTAAFVQSICLSCLISMPAAILLAPVAPFFVLLLFPDKGPPAIPLLKILLLGMGFIVVQGIGLIAIQARGLFKRYLFCNIIMGTAAIAAFWPAAKFGDAQAVVLTRVVTSFLAISAFPIAVAAIAPAKPGAIVKLLAGILVPFALALGARYAGEYLVSRMAHGDQISSWWPFATSLIGSAIYALAACLVMPGTIRAGFGRAAALVARSRKP